LTEQPLPIPTAPPFVQLVAGIVRRPRNTLERLAELPRRPWRRVALLVIVAVLLPLVASFSVTARQFPGRGGATVIEGPMVGGRPSSAMPARGGVAATVVGVPIPEGQPMPAPAPSVLSGIVLPGLGRLGGLVVSWLVWSGVLYVIGTMMGGRNTFGHMFHMVIWTWVPFAVRGLLQAAFIWITGEAITYAGLSGLVVSGVPTAGFAARVSTGTMMLQNLLRQVDIYLFWHLALVAIGLMAMARLPRRKAITLALASWVLLTLLGLVPALIQGSFAGMRMG